MRSVVEILTVVLAVFCGSSFAQASSENSTTSTDRAHLIRDFTAANERALRGDLESAIALYQSILDSGVSNEDLWFNLGNAYAEAGRPVDAVVSYERALRLAPSDDDIRSNLELVRSKLLLKKGKPENNGGSNGTVAIADVIDPIVAPLSLHLFVWLAVVANALMFFALIARRRTVRRRTRRLFSAVLVTAMLVLLVSGTIVAGHAVVATDARAVVTETRELKEGPHLRFKSKGEARAGLRVRVLREDVGWVEILKPDGTTGWIQTRDVTRV